MDRPFVAEFLTSRPLRSKRRNYASLANLISRATRWMVEEGHVMESIELYYQYSGMQIGVIKMNSKGRISIIYNEVAYHFRESKEIFKDVSTNHRH